MFLRPLALLVIAIGLSVAATLYFGHEVLIALGLILTQIKVIGKKLAMVELPLVLAWLKTQTSAFFRDTCGFAVGQRSILPKPLREQLERSDRNSQIFYKDL